MTEYAKMINGTGKEEPEEDVQLHKQMSALFRKFSLPQGGFSSHMEQELTYPDAFFLRWNSVQTIFEKGRRSLHLLH